MAPPGLIDALLTEASASGVDLSRLGVAWARVLPTALFVPAFGLGFLGVSVRVVLALGLSLSLAPSIAEVAIPHGAWLPAVLASFVRGIPIAIVASVSLWAAMVAGGVADTAAGSARLRVNAGALGPRTSPLSTLLGLFAAAAFFETGGAVRLVMRLAAPPSAGLEHAVMDLAAGIGAGAAIGAPFLVVVAALDVASEVARLDRPVVFTESVVAPLRSLLVLVATAALFERVAEGITVFGAGRP